MKISKRQLKKIIQEEARSLLSEAYGDGMRSTGSLDLSGLSSSDIDFLEEMYEFDLRTNSAPGPNMVDVDHAAFTDWLFTKHRHVSPSLKQKVMDLAVKVYQNM